MHFRNLKKNNQDIYINDTIDIDKDGNKLTLVDKVMAKTDVQDETEIKIRIEEMQDTISKCLSEREKQVLVLRYGIGENRPLTQKQVAKGLGISRSYVSRIEKKALETIKSKMKTDN